MHARPTPHLLREQLAAYGLGTLDDAEVAVVVEHLETCESCQRTLDETPSDTFVTALLTARPALEPALPTELADHPRFRVVQELGRGGMGVVYLAEHRLMKRPVAIKVVSKSLVENPRAVERFHREVRAAALLDHPNIVRAYDAEQAGSLHMLVMEYVEGLSLAQVLERRGSLPVAESCHYIRQTALALQHAHERGMVHRDLKPHNLMLESESSVVKVLDFGLARFVSERQHAHGLTAENAVMGTPEYLAPEQATDAGQADIRADIYSLGCTLYCLLSGRPPFMEQTVMQTILAHREQEATPLHEVRSDVPVELSSVLARMIAKDPRQRCQTPSEVVEALAPFCTTGDGPADEMGSKHSRSAPNRGRRRMVNLTVATSVLALGLVVGMLLVTPFKTVRYLSDMAEFDAQVAEGRFAKNGNLGYKAGGSDRIRVSGAESPNGLSMHAPSDDYASVKYQLGKTAHTFLASVALNDSAGAPDRPPGDGSIPTPLTFQVLGDGRVLWESKPVDTAGSVQECKIEVTGVEVLELRVHCPGIYTNAQAVWLEPRVLLK